MKTGGMSANSTLSVVQTLSDLFPRGFFIAFLFYLWFDLCMGRPTRYKKEYINALLQSARRNETIERFCADIGIHTDTYQEWKKKHKAFSVAHKEGLTIRRASFLDKAYNCAFKPDKNPCNNGMAYLYAYALGIRIKPDEKEDKTNDGKEEALREVISNKPG